MEYPQCFIDLWNRYPKGRKFGKKESFKSFKSSIKTQEDLEKINTALDNLYLRIKFENKSTQFIIQASTFFNNWEDYYEYECPEAIEAEEKKKADTESIEYGKYLKRCQA